MCSWTKREAIVFSLATFRVLSSAEGIEHREVASFSLKQENFWTLHILLRHELRFRGFCIIDRKFEKVVGVATKR